MTDETYQGGTMPADWTPVTTTEHVRGKTVIVCRWKGHEIACRDRSAGAYRAFLQECWDLRSRVALGETVSHAHVHRHDATRRRPEHRPTTVPTLQMPPEDDQAED